MPMSRTFSTLGAATQSRREALPDAFARNLPRTALLEVFRQRNATLDAAFYDVSILSDVEAKSLAPWLAHEGAILVAPPSGRGDVRIYDDARAYLEAGDPVKHLAVAGVGSSALGAAALARNVADAIEAPVAAIVSGYGFADLPAEALGGWFWFGGLNSLRHAFEGLDQISRLWSQDDTSQEVLEGLQWVRLSKDTRTLVDLLSSPGTAFDLLVGHSKGNLVISEALYWLRERNLDVFDQVAARAGIITLCARIGMPAECRRVIDVTGEYDWFGALNSRPNIRSDFIVPHAWHSTNREFPFGFGLDVTAAILAVLPQLAVPPPNHKPIGLTSLLDFPQAATAIAPL
jgi:hypothetical protein